MTTTPSSTNSDSVIDVVAVFTQNGDFPEEYIPTIRLYSDGTFDFMYNTGEGMFAHIGYFLYGNRERLIQGI